MDATTGEFFFMEMWVCDPLFGPLLTVGTPDFRLNILSRRW